jgi:hypothetical protein
MYRLILLAVITTPLLMTIRTPAAAPGLVWWTTNALEKVRPFEQVPAEAERSAKIQAAKNEFEPFQVILRAAGTDVQVTDVTVSNLKRADGVILDKKNITVYTERYVDLKTPSATDGGAGEWPDPLVPQVDNYSHERRNAFPFTLVQGRNQPLWVEVYVPKSAAAGSYAGDVTVLVSGKPQIRIPLQLDVWNFELPSTSSLVTTYGFSGIAAVRQHYGKYTNDSQLAALTYLYRKSALRHRISIRGGSISPPGYSRVAGHIQINWSGYDTANAPLLDGQAFAADEPLYGARLTSETIKTPPSLSTDEDQIQYWREVARHFRERGWFDRLFNYVWDEPKPANFPAMVKLGENVRRADPKIPNLVTAPLHSEWSHFIDIWTPAINCFERKPNARSHFCGVTVPPSGYDFELAAGKKLWWYQACGSHGCFIVGSGYFTEWPSYVIDAAGVRNRIQEWMSWKYDMKGELYYQTNEAYGRGKNVWDGDSLHLFGGNGDGTLFYPGEPKIIGGTTDIPIESIRLKLIREGLEDYEYLVALEKLIGRQEIAARVDELVRHMYDFDQDPQKLYGIRQWAGEQIQRHSSSAKGSHPSLN